MPIGDLMMTGLELMLLGMGIVFTFLIVLVGVLKAMSWLAARLPAPEPAADVVAPIRPASTDASVIAAITAAVARYRAGRDSR